MPIVCPTWSYLVTSAWRVAEFLTFPPRRTSALRRWVKAGVGPSIGQRLDGALPAAVRALSARARAGAAARPARAGVWPCECHAAWAEAEAARSGWARRGRGRSPVLPGGTALPWHAHQGARGEAAGERPLHGRAVLVREVGHEAAVDPKQHLGAGMALLPGDPLGGFAGGQPRVAAVWRIW